MITAEVYQKLKKTHTKPTPYKQALFDVNITALARYMNVPDGKLQDVINGRQTPSKELALELESIVIGIARERAKENGNITFFTNKMEN